jgi:type I restriction-modification system DNA methylase subunit
LGIDERTIVANIGSYIKELPDFDAEVENHQDRKRLDLNVSYRKKILFNAEFKLPTKIEGRNARNAKVVEDAYLKASNSTPPTRFFVTSNINETIIWDNRDNTRPLMSRDIESKILPRLIQKEEEFEYDEVKKQLRQFFQSLAQRILELEQNKIETRYKELGDSFIEGLNAHLNEAVNVSANFVPLKILSKWWREQKFEPVAEFGEEEKRRLARYSYYVLAIKLVFYYVLKRTFAELPKVNIEDAEDIDILRKIIDRSFAEAQRVSEDYETVFEKEDADTVPFLDNEQLDLTKSLILFLELYNFSELSQSILGNLYDRLIAPTERHANGQYYTPIPVVNFINALTIKDAHARVMDPACGSGTFLTQAFDLKLNLSEKAGQKDSKELREQILEELFGVDIAPYPVHLATVAVASKLLVTNPDIYPRIIRQDFLDTKFKELIPKYRPKAKTLSGNEKVVEFKPIDAIVSNLPYIRDESIENKPEEQGKVKKMLTNMLGESTPIPSDTADFHVYFWYYMLPFLREGSRVGFLTSDSWLNVDYGDDLKRFINKYFKIVAIIDSSVERWFEDALVNTCITILERTSDADSRENNKVKFVRLNKKIDELIPNINYAVDLAKCIIHAKDRGDVSEDVVITRIIRQGDFNFNDPFEAKLYPYLRAPDEFLTLAKSDKMVKLETVVEVQRGFTTGANAFFYVEDMTGEYSDEKLKEDFDLRRGQTDRLSIVEDGSSQRHVIEKEYLRPVIKSPREFTGEGRLTVEGETKKLVFLVEETDKSKIKDHALAYLSYGEKNPIGDPYSKTKTCSARNPWWKLSPVTEPDIVLRDLFNDTYLFPKTNFLLDHTLYLGKLIKEADCLAVFSFLNSSLFILYADYFGRNTGGGAARFMVYEYCPLPIPKPELLHPFYEGLQAHITSLENRAIGSVFEEIWNLKDNFDLKKVKPDRLGLDRTILNALGFANPDEILLKLYPVIVRTIKERIDKGHSLKRFSSSRGANLAKVADDILNGIKLKHFPIDYVMASEIASVKKFPSGNNVELRIDLDGPFVLIENTKIHFENVQVAKYCYYSIKQGVTEVPIPNSRRVLESTKNFEEDVKNWRLEIGEEISLLTGDEKISEKLRKLCSAKAGLSGILF